MYFVTICCESRGTNQICHESPANIPFETARRYHTSQRCYVYLLLLMPDHLQGLISIGGDVQLSQLIRDFKRITARLAKIRWQTNFFDHRLRQDESLVAKGAYIRANPVRAGLIGSEEEWIYFRGFADFEKESRQRAGD
jgi:putative transposase